MTLLIVDDEEHVLDGFKSIIDWKKIGISNILTATDGATGWEIYKNEEPEIVVTDIYMPGMNGIELVSKIRSVNKEVPIIIFSGYNDFEYASAGISLGVARYLLKPSMPTEIEQVIEDAIEDVYKKKKQEEIILKFNKDLAQNLKILRKKFLEEILVYGIGEKEITNSEMDFMKFSASILKEGVILAIKLYKDIKKDELAIEWQGLKLSIITLIEDIIEHEADGYVIDGKNDSLLILLCGFEINRLIDAAKEIGSRVTTEIWKTFNLKTNIGIGNIYGDISKSTFSKVEALATVSIIEQNGYNQIAYIEEVDTTSFNWTGFYLDEIDLVCETLITGEIDKALSAWEQIRERIIHDNVPASNVKTFGLSIINLLILKDNNEFDNNIFGPRMLNKMQEIYSLGTRNEIVDYINSTLIEVVEMVKLKYSEKRTNKYVAYVIEYVKKHYKENISHAEISEELNISSNYLSNLFKRETGTSFMNYLIEYRIDKAKKLLLTNTYLVYEISELVGYRDSAYFSRLFKKVVGCSPLDYMRRNL